MPEIGQSVEQQTFARQFSFRGDPEFLVAARDTVMEFVHPHCTSEQEELDILIALQEALANAVFHGCKGDPEKTIQCSVVIEPSMITISVGDPGPGFDVATVDARQEMNLTNHGRGICLMRGLMDEVAYRGGGSEVVMKKFRTRPE